MKRRRLVRDTAPAWRQEWIDASSEGHVGTLRNLQLRRQHGEADFILREVGGTHPASLVAGLELIQARHDERATARAAHALVHRWHTPLAPEIVGGPSTGQDIMFGPPLALSSFHLRK